MQISRPKHLEKIVKTGNIILPILAIGAVFANKACDTGCTYLYGNLFGVDLNSLGIALAITILFLSLPVSLFSAYHRITDHLRPNLLAGSLGGGVVLLHFQLVNSVFCPFCILYGILIFILFAFNFHKSNGVAGVTAFLGGLLIFAFFFEGSAVPVFRF